jgi:hypothetical protein
MTEGAQDSKTKEFADRIARLEALVDHQISQIHTTLSNLCDRIEVLERHNVAEYYNRQIDQKLDEYENRSKS